MKSKRKDYTTLTSIFIPHEKKYHFVFPVSVLNKYNGVENLDVTIDDNLAFFILEPILNNQIEYNFEFIWSSKIKNPTLTICLTVNNKIFDSKIVIDNLEKNQMINGLELYKEDFGKMIKLY